MTKYTIIIVLGFFIALMPFFGFPGSWKTVFFVIAGMSVVILTFLRRREITNEKKTDVYIEHTYYDSDKKV